MKTVYFDCFAGASGDMLLGALLDLGLPLDSLKKELDKLNLSGYEINAQRSLKCGISAMQVSVETIDGKSFTSSHHENSGVQSRSLSDIVKILTDAPLPPTPQARALKAFRRLGEVEAFIHNVPIETIHFHELGAIDSIIDITGFFLAMDILNIDRVISSPLPVGYGYINSAHGNMPIPAPATAKILEGVPVFDNGMEGEVLTPTGALLLSESAESFGRMPSMTISSVGHGSGIMDKPMPNIVRAFLGQVDPPPSNELHPETISVLETNIDDMNPEVFPYVIDGALSLGALDAFIIPTVGKKGRPASLLIVLCPAKRQDALLEFIFQETTTLGIRYRLTERMTIKRDWIEVNTPWGRVRIKRAHLRGDVVNLAPEFEDCRKLAESSGVPLRKILDVATSAGREASIQKGMTEES